MNVLHAVDALDPDRSMNLVFKKDPPNEVLFMSRPAFLPDRLDGAPIFKLSSAPRGPAYYSHEFVERNRAAGFAGFDPRLIWDESSGIIDPRRPRAAPASPRIG